MDRDPSHARSKSRASARRLQSASGWGREAIRRRFNHVHGSRDLFSIEHYGRYNALAQRTEQPDRLAIH